MLEGPNTTTSDASAPSSAVSQVSSQTLKELHALLERLQGELKFKQTRIDALNFEVARLKRWRLRLLQREPGEQHAGGAVRRPPGGRRA